METRLLATGTTSSLLRRILQCESLRHGMMLSGNTRFAAVRWFMMLICSDDECLVSEASILRLRALNNPVRVSWLESLLVLQCAFVCYLPQCFTLEPCKVGIGQSYVCVLFVLMFYPGTMQGGHWTSVRLCVV